MPHINYFEIEADSHYDLGLKKGLLFKQPLINSLNKKKQNKLWKAKLAKSKKYLEPANSVFPDLIEELKGYAKGARINFIDLWVLSLEDELSNVDKCTTIITNNGKLIAHNEDEAGSKDTICILKKTLKDLTVLELFYYNTLGGNAISINSHGFIQAVNSLTPTDQRIGIPRNVIARWLSETGSPEKDFDKFSTLQRSAGYNHSFINLQGEIWNIESSANKQKLSQVSYPFIHTNHFLTELKEWEANDNSTGTFNRYDFTNKNVKKNMSLSDLQNLISDKTQGNKISVFNKRTIARMIIDLENLVSYIWLLREEEKGWIKYDLDFLNP